MQGVVEFRGRIDVLAAPNLISHEGAVPETGVPRVRPEHLSSWDISMHMRILRLTAALPPVNPAVLPC
jgi:hypothetical protein